MDNFHLPEDIEDNVEIVYLQDDELIEDPDDMEEVQDIEEIQDTAVSQADTNTDVTDLSRLTFKKHNMSVFTCDLNADGTLVVTGGQDDTAFVWQVSNGELYLECTGHNDSVTEVGFNHDSQYVVTGDLSGLIQVWNIKEKKLIWCYGGDDLEWLTWHHLANVLVAGMESGDIFVWQIPQGNCKVLASHGSPTGCGKILPDGKRLTAGYSDGQIKLWDMKTATVIWQLGDLDDITCLDVNHEGSLITIAPLSHVIKVSDGKIIGQYLNNDKAEIESILFGNDLDILVTGSLSGKLCVWDIAKHSLRHEADLKCPVTSLKWAGNSKLLVSTTDGHIYVCDVRSGTLIQTLTGHKDDILSMCVSKDNTFVVSTSDDSTAKIYDLKAE